MKKYDYKIYGSDLKTYSQGYVMSRNHKEATAKINRLRTDIMALHDDPVVMYFDIWGVIENDKPIKND